MKILWENYTFNPTAKTVTLLPLASNLSSYVSTPLSLENFLLVTNTSSGSIIYNFADPTSSGSFNSSTNVLSLGYNTSAMSSTDKLQIYVDCGDLDATNQSIVELQEHTILLRRMAKLLESQAVVDSAQRQRVVVDSLIAVSTLGTLSTLTTATKLQQLESLAGIPVIENMIQWSRTQAGVQRNQLTFS